MKPRAQLAQVGPSASPEPTPSVLPTGAPAPSMTPTLAPSPGASPTASPSAPAPIIPLGPGVLVPQPLPTGTPAVTPPPIPTPASGPSTTPPPVYVERITPAPSSTPSPKLTAGPIVAPSVTPSPVPSPGETLGPNDYAILADHVYGNRNDGSPFDLDGNVNIIYQDGVLTGEHAHYDGQRYIDVTGNPVIHNRSGDTTLAADSIRFDTVTQRSILINGRGVTTQGVETGKLHYTARQLSSTRDGKTHGDRASFTTCENPHGGYHVEAKTLDITPGDKAIARAAVLFLGPLAILYLPILVIPLRQDQGLGRRQPGFIPLVGYSAAEGYYVKARIGFAPSDYYYGYYRVEGYTKIGFGLGYVASFRRKDNRRSTDVDFFRLKNKNDGTQNTNFNLSDQETFSQSLRATARFNYQGNFGPLISLPPSEQIALGLTKTSTKDVENFSFARQSNGGEVQTNNYGFGDSYTFSPNINNRLDVSYTTNANNSGGVLASSNSLHYNSITHLTGKQYSYDLTIDRYDSTFPSGVDKLPELLIRPNNALFPNLKAIPATATLTLGEYSDPTSHLASSRAEAQINLGPGIERTPIGDLNASVQIRQDAYGTGDEKAQIVQNINLATQVSDHFSNTLSYSNQHVNGLGNEPFSFDTIGGAYKNLSEVFRVFNKDVYALTLQAGTSFNRQAGPISYQLLTRPSPRSYLTIGGAYAPGPGNGFGQTIIQASTPFGRGSDIQFSAIADWKSRGRLTSKNIYYRRVIGDCYEVRVNYNQDLKTVNVSVNLLAFPSQGLNFGLGQQTSIIPTSFASDQFYVGR